MSGPKRYSIRFIDYEAVVRERNRLEQACDEYRTEIGMLRATREQAERERDGLARDCDGLRAELNFARDDIRELAASRDTLCRALDEALRDADRYRWLRDVWWLGDAYFDTPDPMVSAETAGVFDAAIDDARLPRAGE